MASLDLPDNHDLGHLRKALTHFDARGLAVDGGAHRGIWTRELMRHFSRVVAFEPVLDLASQIPCNEVVLGALGETLGTCRIEPGPENTGQGHVVEGEGFVRIEPLDQYVLDVDFLKLDVEGYELPALKGAVETIARCHPAILVEQNGLSKRYGYSDEELSAWLIERGYKHVARFNKDHLYL